MKARLCRLCSVMQAWPLFLCNFRPFFLLTGLSACLLMLIWLALLYGIGGPLSAWQPPGGIVIWHGSELLLGFGMAAVAGFLLTAVSEFTGIAIPRGRPIIGLAIVWLLARLAWLLTNVLPHVVAVGLLTLLNIGFITGIMALVLPALWRDTKRAHRNFAWALLAVWLIQAGFFLALYRHSDSLAWLRLLTGMMMVLLIMAISRISMNVVNRQMEVGKPGVKETDAIHYLARPPRRNVAIVCIILASGIEFYKGFDPVTGWMALAAAAAVLNLLNDWHSAQALRYRWALMLYVGYWLMALGYAGLGLSMLGAPWLPSGARHLLMVGAMGLVIFIVMNIVTRIHSGLWLERRVWLPLAALLLVLAAGIRALSGVWRFLTWGTSLQLLAGLLWIAAFALYLTFNTLILIRARSDGQDGCAEPLRSHPRSDG